MNFLRALKSVLIDDIEEIPYEVKKKTETYEERHYGPSKFVCTKTKAGGRDAVNRELFMKLFDYINGENETQTKIAMTAPVVTRVDPDSDDTRTYTMAFYLPKTIQESEAPKPTNSDVYLEDRPEMTIFTRTFGGYAKDVQFRAERTALEELVKSESGIENSYYFEVGYDPPFKPINRRNEVWLVKKPEGDADGVN